MVVVVVLAVVSVHVCVGASRVVSVGFTGLCWTDPPDRHNFALLSLSLPISALLFSRFEDARLGPARLGPPIQLGQIRFANSTNVCVCVFVKRKNLKNTHYVTIITIIIVFKFILHPGGNKTQNNFFFINVGRSLIEDDERETQ